MTLIEDKIKQYASSLGLKEEEVRQQLSNLAKKVKETYPNLSDDEVKIEALKLLFVSYRRELRSPAEQYTGFFIGDTGVTDIYERRRKLTTELLMKNPQQALQLGLVDSNFRLIDKKGRPLPEKLLLRRLYGIAKIGEIYKRFECIVGDRNKELQEAPIPLFTWTTFRANKRKQSTEDNLVLNLVNVPAIQPFNQDVLEVVRKIFTIRKLSELRTYLLNIRQQIAQQVPVFTFTEGYIVNVNEKEDVKIVYLWDDGVERDIPVFLRSPISNLNIELNWKILVFGKLTFGKTDKGGSDVIITGLGIHPLSKIGGI